MTQKVFIDANVPMLVAGGDSPHKLGCIQFFEKVARGVIIGATSAEVFQELLHRYLTGRDVKKGLAAYDQLRLLVHEVYSIDIEDVDRARRLAAKYKGATARDLLHVAVMTRRGIKHIVSFDTDFDAFDEVERIEAGSL